MDCLLTAVPAPPTHLQAVNITDTRAVLQWTPSLGKVDRFIISYESSKSEWITITLLYVIQDKELSSFTVPFCHSSKRDSDSNGVWKLSGASAERPAERHPIYSESPEPEGQSPEYSHFSYIHYCQW